MRQDVTVAVVLLAALGLVGEASAQTRIWAPARASAPRTTVPVVVRPVAPAGIAPSSAPVVTVPGTGLRSGGVAGTSSGGPSGGWGGVKAPAGSRSVRVTTERAAGAVPGSTETRVTVRDTTGVGAVAGPSAAVTGMAAGHRRTDQRIRVVEQPAPGGGREVEVTVESGRDAPPVEPLLIILVE